PSPELPSTLRPRRVSSAFEEQFGVGSSSFEVPSTSDPLERAQSVMAQIARAAGEPLATVERVFEAGLLAPLTSAADLLALPAADVQQAYRQAVGAVYRVAVWARRLRVD